jgi:hypothetical protein
LYVIPEICRNGVVTNEEFSRLGESWMGLGIIG